MEIKERIKMLMTEKHLTQKELAISAGITEASMSKYLSGERTPRIDVVVNLANALGVSTDELIGNEVENEKMDFIRMKTILARGLDNLSKEDKNELIKFLLEN
ncbi:MAG: helix-turn-helix transcriptional regulator [Bacilli bacterium]|nr:helix-turn-helix domain-containing protein [Erysipelotrichaceae bacterium]MDY4818812.1 helix-turn-helix transcriptional regulator [Bacilli bacterium]